MAALTLDEKVHIMSGNTSWRSELFGLLKRGKKGVYNWKPYLAGGIQRLGIPPIKFVDGPRGVVCGHSTCFPVAMARGASWDVDLEQAIGEVIGIETRAHGGNYFGGVCINLLRHPAWGRAQETYGEDSHLLGEMGAALTRGVQRHNVMACVKHFALNSLENKRFKVDVKVDERTLREVYLPHFKKCIVEAKAASVMSAYNKVNGTYCGENGYLLHTILRDEWGFEGFVVSDFIWGTHNAVASVENGLDIEMHIKRKFGALHKAAQNGEIAETKIDRAVSRILGAVFDYTERTDIQEYPASCIGAQEHIALSQKAAEESMVLLKNHNNVLPFDANKINTIAVIGTLANKPNIGDHGSSLVRPKYVTTALEGIRRHLSGTTKVVYHDGKNLHRAKEVAANADAVVLVVGNDAMDEGEYVVNSPLFDNKFLKKRGVSFGGDRDDLSLKDKEIQLIKAVASCNDNCCVTVVGGSAIMMEAWKNEVPAILMAWYAGMEGGTALARILFGDVVPSGKLPFSIAANNEDMPPFDKKAEKADYGYYHGYTLLDREQKQAAFAFGHGLSYTDFSYSNLILDQPQIKSNGELICRVEVSNTGRVSGREVVQLYLGCASSAVHRPLKRLVAFKKVSLAPSETKTVSFVLPATKTAYYSEAAKKWVIEKTGYTLYAGGSSEPQKLLHTSFSIA